MTQTNFPSQAETPAFIPQPPREGAQPSNWTFGGVLDTLYSYLPNVKANPVSSESSLRQTHAFIPLDLEPVEEQVNARSEISNDETEEGEFPDLPLVGIDEIDLGIKEENSEVAAPKQQEPGITSVCINKVKNIYKTVGKAVQNTANGRLELYGNDINPIHYATKGIKYLYRNATGYTPPTPHSVLEELSSIRQELDQRIDRIPPAPPTPLSISQAIRLEAADEADVVEQASIEETYTRLLAEEQQEKAKLIKNLKNFASFRLFNEKIMGNSPEDPMKYYNQFINAENPNQLFYQQYGFIGGLVARILVPIIQWIIGLVLSSRADKLSGISAVQNVFSEYLKDKENVRFEIKEIFSTANDYFLKLHLIYEEFAQGMGGTLTINEYMKKRLEEDLTDAGLSKSVLYRGLNDWIVEMINVKTEIPIIGCLLDKIITPLLKGLLNKLNIVENALGRGLGTNHANPAFTYNITKLIVEKVKQLTETLKTLPTDAPSNVAALNLTEEEKEIIETLYGRILRHLPLEGASEEEIAILLEEEENPNLRRTALEKIEARFVDWDAEIAKNLEGPFNDLFSILYSEFSNKENLLRMLTDLIKSGNNLFEESSETTEYTAEALQAIHNEAMDQLNQLTDALLDRQFDDEIRKKHREAKCIEATTFIQQSQIAIQEGFIKLDEVQQRLEKIGTESTPAEIEAQLNKLISQLKEFSSMTYNAVSTCERFNLDPETSETFASEMQALAGQMKEIIKIYDRNLERIPYLRLYESLQTKAEASLQEIDAGLESATDILPGLSIASLSETLDSIIEQMESSKLLHFDRIEADIVNIAYNAQQIKESNTLIIQHDRSHRLLNDIKETIELVADIKHQISSRPAARIRQALITDISHFKQLSNELLSVKLPSENISRKIDNYIQVFQQLTTSLTLYPELNTGSLNLYLQNAGPAIEELREIKELLNSNHPNFASLKQKLNTQVNLIGSINPVERQINGFANLNAQAENSISILIADLKKYNRDILVHREEIGLPSFNFEDTFCQLLATLDMPQNPDLYNLVQQTVDLLEPQMASLSHSIDLCLQHRQAQREDFNKKLETLMESINTGRENCLAEIRESSRDLDQILLGLLEAKDRIHGPIRYPLDPLSKTLAVGEKSRVKSRVRNLQKQLYTLVTKPEHIEQILLRGPLRRLDAYRANA